MINKFFTYLRNYEKVSPILFCTYTLIYIFMNIFACKTIFMQEYVGIDGGYIISGFMSLIADIVIFKYGEKAAISMSVVASMLMFFASFLFILISYVPGEWACVYEFGYEGTKAVDYTFRLNMIIVLGSIFAFLVSSVVNAKLNVFLGKIGHKYFGRVSISTMIAQVVDNILFTFMITKPLFGWSMLQCVTNPLIGAIIELVSELVLFPICLIYLAKSNKGR